MKECFWRKRWEISIKFVRFWPATRFTLTPGELLLIELAEKGGAQGIMGMRGAFDSYRSAGRAPKWLYNPGSDHQLSVSCEYKLRDNKWFRKPRSNVKETAIVIPIRKAICRMHCLLQLSLAVALCALLAPSATLGESSKIWLE